MRTECVFIGRCYARLISRDDMAFVLAVLGGAAAVEISKLLHKDKHSPKDLEDLEEKEHELRLLVKASHALRTSPASFHLICDRLSIQPPADLQELEEELQDERKAHQVNSKRVQELSATAEQLEHVKSELEQESATLRTDKAQLLQRTETLVQQQAELRQTSEGLRVENTSLTQQVSPPCAILMLPCAPLSLQSLADCAQYACLRSTA